MALNRLFPCFLVCAFVACLMAGGAAQVNAEERAPIMSEQDIDKMIYDAEIIDDIPQPKNDQYVVPNIQNLSKLYWAIGKLDLDNPKLIDYFLMINECDMYMQFYHNDFEWQSIQKATRDYILDNMGSFSTQFEIMSQIGLGRYNIEKQEFEILNDDKIIGLRRLDFAMNPQAYKKTCSKTGEIYDYPGNMIIILSRPLTIESIPVERELAQLYIEEAKRNYELLPPQLQMSNYERVAYLRLKVRITQYKNTIRVLNGALRAVVFGVLDGYEVYADVDKLKPLYLKDTRDKRFRRLRQGEGNDLSAADTADPEKQSGSVLPAKQEYSEQ